MGKNNINLDLHIRGFGILFMISLYLALKVNKGPTLKSILASIFIPFIYIPYILSEEGIDIIWRKID
tara:strand:- start:57 stop:257 length:201 start_codon:yes stop_codon:yes gene_type:complete